MGQLSAFVQQYWGSWRILILSFLSLVLGIWSFANLLLLSTVVGSSAQIDISQSRIWTVFILNVFFGVTFVISAYGLWRRHNWGRLLFMGCIIIWSVFYILALFTSGVLPENYTAGVLIINVTPLMGVLATIFYLNLPHIKLLFDPKTSAKKQISESEKQQVNE